MISGKNDQIVFKFLKPNSNDKLSQISGFDLQDLLVLINEYYLVLRNTLNLKASVTFGLELDFENAQLNITKNKLRQEFNNMWIIKSDGSLHNGAEINSTILNDNSESWKTLKEV